jgi:alkaline phosphatase
MACGIKTLNRAIGVDSLHRPCGTILEAAKLQGYKTGMVVTAKVTDATPACFASHVLDRTYENAIAEQLIGGGPLERSVDLLFGGT